MLNIWIDSGFLGIYETIIYNVHFPIYSERNVEILRTEGVDSVPQFTCAWWSGFMNCSTWSYLH